MEGLEVSEISLKYILSNNDIFRVDSTYFQKEYLKDEGLIRSHRHDFLEKLSTDIKSFGAYSLNNEVEYLDDGVPFIRGVDMKNGTINFDSITHISESAHQLLWKSEVKPEMVLLSMSGTIGDVAIALKNWKYPINSSQDLAKIDTGWKINPYYLYCYLRSKFGQNFLMREARGSVQQHVFLSQINKLQIPILGNEFTSLVEKVIKTAHSKLLQSQTLFASAETRLLHSLGLLDYDFDAGNYVNSNIKPFSASFLDSGRLDSEYYQRKYDKLLALCSSKAVYMKRIEEIKTFNARGLQPEYIENGEVDVINSRHILENHLDYDNFEKTTLQKWHLHEKAQVEKNDILIYTTGANIGRSQVYLKSDKALASNHVNILRVEDENPVYVAFVLNSKIGRLQTEQMSAGSAQQELYPKHIAQFYIPFIHKHEQNEISSSVVESLNSQILSQKLFTLAKQAVETAIEQGEAAGKALLELALSQETT